MSFLRWSAPYRIFVFLSLYALVSSASSRALTNKEILVLYNSEDPESLKLAEYYQQAREIPETQILGLKMPRKPDISRTEFNQTILTPLREHFDQQNWWTRSKNSEDLLLPTENKIRAIVLMRGVPLRITPQPTTQQEADPVSSRNEASVDSELAMFGIENLPIQGALRNPFFESKAEFLTTPTPFLVLTSRIDAPTYATCERMIIDAIATEQTGLWGRAYVDIANKFPEGDQWLEKIISDNFKIGIPTLIDRFNDTLPKNYPLNNASLYYGWYDLNVSGPFLHPDFHFRPGAIAIHIHSFSAAQLANPDQNWAAPLLARGAAATLGNAYEPYLHLTHHLEIFHSRLLQGWTFCEAAWASLPITSWQEVTLGDPLYRPFKHLHGTGENQPEDRDFRAIAAATRQWAKKPETLHQKLATIAEKLSSGTIAESLASQHLEYKNLPEARNWFTKAKSFYSEPSDKLRQDLQLIAIERTQNNYVAAIAKLRAAQEEYHDISEVEAMAGWLDILDPPAPPLADPTKIPSHSAN